MTQQQMISVRWNGLIVLFQWNLYYAASGKQCPGWLIYHLLLVVVSECQFVTVYTLEVRCFAFHNLHKWPESTHVSHNWPPASASLHLQDITAANWRFFAAKLTLLAWTILYEVALSVQQNECTSSVANNSDSWLVSIIRTHGWCPWTVTGYPVLEFFSLSTTRVFSFSDSYRLNLLSHISLVTV